MKCNADSDNGRYKERLLSFISLRKEVEYNESMSSVAQSDMIRTVVSAAAHEKLEVCSQWSCKLRKYLFGLKQRVRCCKRRLKTFIIYFNLQESAEDPEPVGSFTNVNQKRYAEDILWKFNMEDADSVSTATEMCHRQGKENAEMSVEYRLGVVYCVWQWLHIAQPGLT